MYREERPPWLVRQENGEIGEARSRAFLLDRFWILERSVDVEGADFIIQQRLTSRSLLDPVPPRLGFVQAKYYATVDTTHHIHREYIIDAAGAPRGEFFVLAHTGEGDNAKAYFLSSTDVVSDFGLAPPEHPFAGRFILPGRRVLTPRYQIMNPSRVLDGMERALRGADFRKNRFFLSWALPSQTSTAPPIQEMFFEPIENWWGDIPEALRVMRATAARSRHELEALVDQLHQIEESDDPEKALAIAEEVEINWGGQVRLPTDLFHEDFLNAVRRHRVRFMQLKSSGALQSYALLHRTALEYILTDLAPRMPMDKRQVYVVHVQYDRNLLTSPQFVSRVELVGDVWPNFEKSDPYSRYEDIPAAHGILRSRPGEVEVYLLPGRVLYKRGNGPGPDDGSWRQRIKDTAEVVVGELTAHLLDLRFGELDRVGHIIGNPASDA